MSARSNTAALIYGLDLDDATRAVGRCPISSPREAVCLTDNERFPCATYVRAFAVLMRAGWNEHQIEALDLRTGPMVMMITMVTRDRGEVEQASVVAAVHVPDDAGFCRGCLEVARLAWSPCPQAVWGLAMLAAVEAGEPQ